MNSKVIHTLLFLLLLSMTAQVVHASTIHKNETCEVCIHVQFNDDWVNESTNHYLVFDIGLHNKFIVENHLPTLALQQAADLIRGSPLTT